MRIGLEDKPTAKWGDLNVNFSSLAYLWTNDPSWPWALTAKSVSRLSFSKGISEIDVLKLAIWESKNRRTSKDGLMRRFFHVLWITVTFTTPRSHLDWKHWGEVDHSKPQRNIEMTLPAWKKRHWVWVCSRKYPKSDVSMFWTCPVSFWINVYSSPAKNVCTLVHICAQLSHLEVQTESKGASDLAASVVTLLIKVHVKVVFMISFHKSTNENN